MTTASVSLPLGVWSPTAIAGLVGWYKADELVLSPDDPVATWPDASGESNDLAEATNRPIYKTNIQNGLPIVRFDGSNDKLALADTGKFRGTGGFAIFMVFAGTHEDGGAIFGTKTVATQSYGYGAQYQGAVDCVMRMRAGSSGGSAIWILDSSDVGAAADWAVWTYTFDAGTGAKIQYNGTQVATTTDSDIHDAGTDAWTLGAWATGNNATAIDVGELLIYEPDISDADRDLIEAYLGAKWGITVT